MTNLSAFIQSVGLTNKVPFYIDFEIKPKSHTGEFKEVAGFKIPVLGSLTVKESFIFEQLEINSGYTQAQADFTDVILAMARELNQAIPEATLAECVGYVYETPEAIQQHPNFPTYVNSVINEQMKITEISKALGNPMLLLAKLAFMLMSRVDANLGLSEVCDFTQEQVNALTEFLASEQYPSEVDSIPSDFVSPPEVAEVPEVK